MYSSVSRGLQIIEILAKEQRPLGLTEIAQRLGTSKSGVHALLATLVRSGFAERGTGGIYRLGMKAWEIGRAVPAATLVRVASPLMDELVNEVKEGAILGILDGSEVVYVHLAESAQAVRVHASIGDRIPAHCTSTGLALLATQDDAYVERVLPRKLTAFTPQSIVDRRELMSELRRIRARGYAINRGGWRSDVGGVAVPINDSRGALCAGLCIAAPLYRMTKPWVARSAPRLLRAATAIAVAMSATPVPARRAA
jgi:IclR family KDG regulon transcriptional repressor